MSQSTTPAGITSLTLRWAIKLPIWAYRLTLSSFLGNACRYYPTCSVYALEAIDSHGPLRGGLLALKRIGRCHPWGGSGVDPVPPSNDDTSLNTGRLKT